MHQYNDGGREAAGYKGKARDCGARAMAIALGIDYKEAYDIISEQNKLSGNPRSARDGVNKDLYSGILNAYGWQWVPAPKFEGRKSKARDLPKGTYIARQAKHYVAVIDGVCHDSWDSSEKMVYGYWENANV